MQNGSGVGYSCRGARASASCLDVRPTNIIDKKLSDIRTASAVVTSAKQVLTNDL